MNMRKWQSNISELDNLPTINIQQRIGGWYFLFAGKICRVPINVLEQIANLSVVNSACGFESYTLRLFGQ